MDRDVKWYPNVDLICIFLIVGAIEHIKINLLDIGISVGLCGSPLLICKSSFYRKEVGPLFSIRMTNILLNSMFF